MESNDNLHNILMAFYSAIIAYEWNFMESDYIKGLIPDEWYFSQKYRISLSFSLSKTSDSSSKSNFHRCSRGRGKGLQRMVADNRRNRAKRNIKRAFRVVSRRR